jgi:hypothetical protein
MLFATSCKKMSPIFIMESVIALIGMTDVTKATFGLDAYGSWISCVGLAPLPHWFTVYRSARQRLDGASEKSHVPKAHHTK